MDKYNRSIRMLCPTCGATDFEFETEESELVKCASCERELTKDELIQENDENIQQNVKEATDEAVKDIEKELTKSLKKAFKGNKNIKIK